MFSCIGLLSLAFMGSFRPQEALEKYCATGKANISSSFAILDSGEERAPLQIFNILKAIEWLLANSRPATKRSRDK